MKDAVDILNEEIQRLRALLADLLADCDELGLRTRRAIRRGPAMSDSPFNFAPLGDQRDHHEHYTAGQRLNVEIGRLRQRESMLEAQIEVLELTIGKLRCVCDAAFTLVREDCGSDDCTDDGEGARSAWQELVSALEDIGYQPVDNPDA